MSVLAFHREPTFNFFLHTKLAGFAPQPFSLDTTSAACSADVTNVVRFNMLVELLTEFLDSLAVRNAGQGLPATGAIRVTPETPQSGAYLANVSANSGTVSSLLSLELHAGRLMVDEID